MLCVFVGLGDCNVPVARILFFLLLLLFLFFFEERCERLASLRRWQAFWQAFATLTSFPGLITACTIGLWIRRLGVRQEIQKRGDRLPCLRVRLHCFQRVD